MNSNFKRWVVDTEFAVYESGHRYVVKRPEEFSNPDIKVVMHPVNYRSVVSPLTPVNEYLEMGRVIKPLEVPDFYFYNDVFYIPRFYQIAIGLKDNEEKTIPLGAMMSSPIAMRIFRNSKAFKMISNAHSLQTLRGNNFYISNTGNSIFFAGSETIQEEITFWEEIMRIVIYERSS